MNFSYKKLGRRVEQFSSTTKNTSWFQNSIIAVILLSAVIVGIKTYPGLYETYKLQLYVIDAIILAIFTIEIAIRILSYGARPWKFFRSGWNIFDFIVTAVFYIPGIGEYTAILRIARILRVFRLITTIPRLQMLVGALFHSIPSMGYIGLLLFIQFYVFAVVGNVLFATTTPEHFGNLHLAMLSLFKVVTLDNWGTIMDSAGQHWYVAPYFILFILSGTMIILNLFIGVIMSGFEEVKKEYEEELNARSHLADGVTLESVRTQLTKIQEQLDTIISKQKKG